jgi:putative ABC transport system substrate-binding protein
MRRREFIALAGSAAAWPLAARAQQPERMRRMAVLLAGDETDPQWQGNLAALKEGLAKLGWTVGRNLVIDTRSRMNDVERTRAATAEMLRLSPDAILADGTPALRTAQQATRTVPIVFTMVSEPVAQGFVSSLAHPAGNITGFTNLEPSIGGKWLDLLKEAAPRVTRATVIFSPVTSAPAPLFFHSVEAAAKKLGVTPVLTPFHDLAEIEAIITMLGREPGGGLIFPSDSFVYVNRKLIIERAARYRLPAIYASRDQVADGALMSYGIDVADLFRQAAGYADRILRGAKPADLPVQQPTKFKLVINLKTANALGLDVPLHLQQLADEVIE